MQAMIFVKLSKKKFIKKRPNINMKSLKINASFLIQSYKFICFNYRLFKRTYL